MFWKRKNNTSWSPQSLTGKLSLFYATSAFLLLFVASLVLYFSLEHRIKNQNEDIIQSELKNLKNLITNMTSVKVNDALKQEIITETEVNHNRYMARIIGPDNNVILQSPNMGKLFKNHVFPIPYENSLSSSEAKIVSVDKHVPYMLMSIFAKHQDKTYLIQVGLDLTRSKRIVKYYRHNLIFILFFGILLSTLIGIYITRKGLKPLYKINQALNKVKADKLHLQLQPNDWPLELVETVAELNRMLARIDGAFDRLSRFSSDIAHELRTPLNNIIGQSEIVLHKERETKEYKEALISNLEESHRLTSLIESMLFIARASDPNKHITLITFNTNDEIGKVIEYFDLLAKEKDISITLIGTATLRAEPMLFKRAISNLISNAIKYSDTGDSITVTIQETKNSTHIIITDTGIGIEQTHIPHLFDRFYRIDEARSRIEGGVGLGLAIVKSIMTLHHGDILIDSQINEGTSFTLIFPH